MMANVYILWGGENMVSSKNGSLVVKVATEGVQLRLIGDHVLMAGEHENSDQQELLQWMSDKKWWIAAVIDLLEKEERF